MKLSEVAKGYDYSAKADKGKPKISLCPTDIIRAISVIRDYGVQKYREPDNWKRVERERYVDALGRHFLAYLDDPYGLDEESHLPHLWHLATNVAFLCYFDREKLEEAMKATRDCTRCAEYQHGVPTEACFKCEVMDNVTPK